MQHEMDTLLTAREVQRALRISRATLQRLIARRAIPSLKIGRRRLFRPQDVQEFIDKRLQASGDEEARRDGAGS